MIAVRHDGEYEDSYTRYQTPKRSCDGLWGGSCRLCRLGLGSIRAIHHGRPTKISLIPILSPTHHAVSVRMHKSLKLAELHAAPENKQSNQNSYDDVAPMAVSMPTAITAASMISMHSCCIVFHQF